MALQLYHCYQLQELTFLPYLSLFLFFAADSSSEEKENRI